MKLPEMTAKPGFPYIRTKCNVPVIEGLYLPNRQVIARKRLANCIQYITNTFNKAKKTLSVSQDKDCIMPPVFYVV